jgi:hypothetical protein
LPERGHCAQADQRHAAHHDAGEHQASWAEPVDDPPRKKSEERAHNDFSNGITGRHRSPGPSKICYPEVIEKGKTIKHNPHQGKKTEKASSSDLKLSFA